VIRLGGSERPILEIAERTLSRDSLTARFASPTILKLGKPEDECTCTSISIGLIPCKEIVLTLANIQILVDFLAHCNNPIAKNQVKKI
jgi:hypothetical protein